MTTQPGSPNRHLLYNTLGLAVGDRIVWHGAKGVVVELHTFGAVIKLESPVDGRGGDLSEMYSRLSRPSALEWLAEQAE